jgi:hypothetical protein
MLHTRVLDALRDYFGYKPPIIDNDSIKVADAQGKAVPTVGEVTLSTTIGSVTKNLSFLVSSNINEYCILSWMDCIQLGIINESFPAPIFQSIDHCWKPNTWLPLPPPARLPSLHATAAAAVDEEDNIIDIIDELKTEFPSFQEMDD